MKTAIDNNGFKVEVSDDTVIKNIDGVNYLLNDNDLAEIAEREAEWEAGASEKQNQLAKRNRAATYIMESDSLFFKAQRGEATNQEWLNKVAEIREKYPYTK